MCGFLLASPTKPLFFDVSVLRLNKDGITQLGPGPREDSSHPPPYTHFTLLTRTLCSSLQTVVFKPRGRASCLLPPCNANIRVPCQ